MEDAKKLFLNNNSTRFILSNYSSVARKDIDTPFGPAKEIYVNKHLKPSKQSEIGSESYRASLSRAFNRAKRQIYFNPDMTKFATFTYEENMTDPDRLLRDMKYMIQKQKRATMDNLANGKESKSPYPKYIYVVEAQDRGALHVHMISNDFLDTYQNKNNHPSVTHWEHGFSGYKDIKDTDSNFKPYLYLFKYMSKAQRIGPSFVHASRNLSNYDELTDFEFDKKVHEHKFTDRTTQGYTGREVVKKYYEKPKENQ